jgi:hypothetical protein
VQDYDPFEDAFSERADEASPQSPELRHFNAYMNRELPATIRRALQAALDRDLVHIEETLKNQLENIVRDVHETLTRNYVNPVQQPTETSSGTIAGPVNEAGSVGNWPTTNLNAGFVVQPAQSQNDALAPFSIPPDARSPYLHQLPVFDDSSNTGTSFGDSGYHSYSMYDDNICFDEAWLQPDPTGESAIESLSSENLPREINFETTTPFLPLSNQSTEPYNGKGKGRADPDVNFDTRQPDFGPWIPNRSA